MVSPAKFDKLLDSIYGKPFTSDKAAPANPDDVRRDGWEPNPSSWTTGRGASQRGRRIVDVTLRDILAAAQRLPAARRQGWLAFADAMTLLVNDEWDSFATSLDRAVGEHDGTSGYLWAALLAGISSALPSKIPTPTELTAIIRHTPAGHLHPLYARIQQPRGRSGNSLHVIKEIADPKALSLQFTPGSEEALRAYQSSSSLSAGDKHLVLLIVGATVSTDLWRHAAAVRHLLLPAVTSLRSRFGITFNLDSPSKTVEKLIDEALADDWRIGGVW